MGVWPVAMDRVPVVVRKRPGGVRVLSEGGVRSDYYYFSITITVVLTQVLGSFAATPNTRKKLPHVDVKRLLIVLVCFRLVASETCSGLIDT